MNIISSHLLSKINVYNLKENLSLNSNSYFVCSCLFKKLSTINHFAASISYKYTQKKNKVLL